MCFSASSSIVVSSLLMGIGILTLKKNKSQSQLPLALIPIFFAIQQFIEGILWIFLQKTTYSDIHIIVLSYLFLFFALFFWPIWIPLSLFFLEKNEIRKKFILLALINGIFVGIYSAYSMLFYGVNAEIISNHIFYHVQISDITKFSIFYFISTILPFFISSNPMLWVFGILISIFLYLSYIFYIQFLLSIWCFFCAVLSLFIYFIVKKHK